MSGRGGRNGKHLTKDSIVDKITMAVYGAQTKVKSADQLGRMAQWLAYSTHDLLIAGSRLTAATQ